MTGWNFVNQNLAQANFDGSALTNASFANANLTNASFYDSTLTNASFAGAIINGTAFRSTTGFTAAQLYSTASYANHDLKSIQLWSINLTGWNFTNHDLANARFSASTLTNALFVNANLTKASFAGSNLTGTNFTGADLRSAGSWSTVASTVTHNAIRPNGSIEGLSLLAGETLTIRNYTLPIKVNGSAAFDPTATLQIVLNGDAWGSTMSFAAGISVALGGALDLDFAAGANPVAQIGRTFDLFNWTGVSPTGSFTIDSPYQWDLSRLYTTGEVVFLAASGIPGDFNDDDSVDAADYIVWRKGLGTTYSQAAYDVWRSRFGQNTGSGSALTSGSQAAVPEPSSMLFAISAVIALLTRRDLRRTIGST
jgi:hypothetical protein